MKTWRCRLGIHHLHWTGQMVGRYIQRVRRCTRCGISATRWTR